MIDDNEVMVKYKIGYIMMFMLVYCAMSSIFKMTTIPVKIVFSKPKAQRGSLTLPVKAR